MLIIIIIIIIIFLILINKITFCMTDCHSKGHCTLSNTLQPEVLYIRKMLMPLLYKMVYLLYKY